MPALPPVPGVIKLQLQGTFDASTTWANVLYFLFSGSATSVSDFNTWMNAVANSWATQFASIMAPEVVLTSLKATDLSSSTGLASFILVSKPGTAGVGPLPANCAITIKHFIARRYRGGHPKTFLPAPTNDSTTNMLQWKPAFATNTLSKWNSFIAAAKVTTGALTIVDHVNVSFYHGFTNITDPVTGRAEAKPTLRTTPLVDTITASIVDPNVGSQRRRLT
jgi:hypothetical protein